MVEAAAAVPAPLLSGKIPSIQIYVRHSEGCRYKADETWRKCKCRKHLRWSENGTQHRVSARTRSWTIAEDAKRKLEAQFSTGASGAPQIEETPRKTIDYAIDLFIKDKHGQGINEGVIKKYRRELDRFHRFMASRNKPLVDDINLELLTEYKSAWSDLYPSSHTRNMVQTRLKTFLRFCYQAKWIDRVPRMSPIKLEAVPTLPLEPEQYGSLLQNIKALFPDAPKAAKVRALVQLMRWSALAIRDAVTLEREEIVFDSKKKLYRIVTNRQKTGTHVAVPIPTEVAKELLAVTNGNTKFLFWTGSGKEQSAVTNWQHELRWLFRSAGMPEGHPHMLRDTAAVGWLEKGVPLEEVSKLLGHESIKTTERAYSPWVKARQDRLDDLVVATWKKKGGRH